MVLRLLEENKPLDEVVFFDTGMEFDSIYHNRYSRMVGMAKDISAGAVMFATIISILVRVILFGSKFLGQF